MSRVAHLRVLVELGLEIPGPVVGYRCDRGPGYNSRAGRVDWHTDRDCAYKWAGEGGRVTERRMTIREVLAVPEEPLSGWCMLCKTPVVDVASFGLNQTFGHALVTLLGDVLAGPFGGARVPRVFSTGQSVSQMFAEKVPGCLETGVEFRDVYQARVATTLLDLFAEDFPAIHAAASLYRADWAKQVSAFMSTDAWVRMQAAAVSDTVARSRDFRRVLDLPSLRGKSRARRAAPMETLLASWYDAAPQGWADRVRADLGCLGSGERVWLTAYPSVYTPSPQWRDPLDREFATRRECSVLAVALSQEIAVLRFPFRRRLLDSFGGTNCDTAGNTVAFLFNEQLAQVVGFGPRSYYDRDRLPDRGYDVATLKAAALLHDGSAGFDQLLEATAGARV